MKTLSNHAQAAKLIRQDLKKAFPAIKFSVTSSSYAGGTSIYVEWTNGPPRDDIESIVSKYQYGHFDGMIDLYEMTNCRSDIPQVKFVQTRREISDEIFQGLFDKMKLTYDGWDKCNSFYECSPEFLNQWGCWTPREYIYRQISRLDLTNTQSAYSILTQ